MINRLSKIKTLIGVIIFLLLTNLVLLYFIVFEKPASDKARENSTTYLLQKKVGFTDDQIAQYKQLKEAHYKKVQPYFDSLKVTKANFYRLLAVNNDTDSGLHSSSLKISEQENILNIELFKFYKTARTICQPKQYALFDSLIVRQMSSRMRRSGRK